MLGGTVEGRLVGDALAEAGHAVTTSVAGRTAAARTLASGGVTGGFGGPDGLAAWLTSHSIDALVDATHPFAARMTRHAAWAADATGVPLVRLDRPGWGAHPQAPTWTWVSSHAEAARAAAGRGRALLTVGRQPLPHYAALATVYARVAELPAEQDRRFPDAWMVVAARGPFTLAAERRLMTDARIGVLVTKDSGGASTAAKLEAAAELDVPVVVVRRPALPVGLACVPDVAGVLAWVAAR